MNEYIIYTDGSCLGNGKEGARGGWAFVCYNEKKTTVAYGKGTEQNTTNNRMELTAAIMALSTFETYNPEEEKQIILKSDSAYLINCWKQKWYKNWIKNDWVTSKKTPVENKELWLKLIPFFENPNITFEKVKGHSGVMGNEICDRLAKDGIERNEEMIIYVSGNNSSV